MKKKIFAVLAVCAIAACTTFTACKKTPTDTFEGEVSSQAYTSQQAAAAACIQEEISGSDAAFTLTKTEKQSDLSEKEIKKLKITDKVNGKVESVEKVKAYYVCSQSARSAEASSDGTDGLYITIYIIKFIPQGATTSQYKYFVPLPEVDEALTKSYYNSVLNPQNYKNCTVTTTTSTTVTANTNGATPQTQTQTSTVFLSISESAIKMDMNVMDQNVSLYAVTVSDELKWAMVVGPVCTTITSEQLESMGLNFNSVSDIYTSGLNEAQHSLFIKTDYGFTMNADTLTELVKDTFNATFNAMGLYGTTIEVGDSSCEYRVKGGKVVSESAKFKASVTVQGTKVSAASEVSVEFKDFGKTKITLPEKVKTVLKLN